MYDRRVSSNSLSGSRWGNCLEVMNKYQQLFALLLYVLYICGAGALYDGKVFPLNGTYELIPQNFIEIVYQLPPQQRIEGIVFLAHGCAHSATDWWPKSPTCESCIGLPVERAIVEEVLRNGYLAVAQNSHNRKRKCWVR